VNTLYRYSRAFLLALKMTLRGEKFVPVPPHPVVAWTQQLVILTDDVYAAADRSGLDQQAQQSIKLRLDGRLMSLETVLAAVKFHGAQEYPNLLQNGLNRDILNTIYASNINDQYWISRLIEAESLSSAPLQAALTRLKTHLDEVPPMEAEIRSQ
jgi:hypothetical protein